MRDDRVTVVQKNLGTAALEQSAAANNGRSGTVGEAV